jgi:hypothetical protein
VKLSESVRIRVRSLMRPCSHCHKSLSIHELSRLSGIDRQALGRFMKGESISLDTLDALAEWLDGQEKKR